MERGDQSYSADIRWTTHGVAHISAADWGSLGFGQGYACARDHLPTIVDQVVKVRSERALFHGPGRDGAHLASDFGYLALGVRDRAVELRAAQPPSIRAFVGGYAAGCNAWLTEATAEGALPAWASGAAWMRPVDELDLWTYYVDVGMLASGRNLAEVIGRAEAPGPDGPAAPSPMSALGGGEGASNGWAFGGDATASGHGLVVANPHFPWGGEARFWECHITIPGVVDAYGVSLIGTPGVQMGCNEGVAWAHTFSRGHRFTLARLDLVAGDPTSYRYGPDTRQMTPSEVQIEVVGADGSVESMSRTLWRTHHGPMVNLPLIGWGLDVGFTYRDANLDNDHFLAQFLGMDLATNMDDFQAVFANVQGMPWVNTLAADRTGRAWYVDASATPHLTPTAVARFEERIATDVVAALLHDNGVALLDGSEPDDEWVDHPEARSPGLLPYRSLPQLERRDYVVNANDSHWLSHADDRIEGHSPLHGLEGTARSLRTRLNLRTARRLAEAGDVTPQSAVAAMLDNQSFSAELLCDQVIARLRTAERAHEDDDGADGLAGVADVLEGWDRRYDLASVGAVLWREIMAGFEPTHLTAAGPLFAEPFDRDRPVDTPTGLAPATEVDPIVVATLAAVEALRAAGIEIDAPLGEVQWAQRGDVRVPVHGGTECDGVLNVLSPIGSLTSHSLEPGPPPLPPIPGRPHRSGLAVGGYRCTYGTSFLMAVELTDHGPVGHGLLAYGQSGDPTSVHHGDGTVAFSEKATRPLLFTDADIEADPNLVRRTVRG